MSDDDTDNELSLSQILYALILALTPFIEGLIAQADAEGQPVSTSLRSLARTLEALRVIAAVFGKRAALPEPSGPLAPKARPANRAQSPSAIRCLMPEQVQVAALVRAVRHAIIPEPARALRL